MVKGRIWLGQAGNEQLLSSLNRKFFEEEFELTQEDRTASGRFVEDVTAVKKRFEISYSSVTGAVLEQLKSIYNSSGSKKIKIEREDGSIDEYWVKIRPFGRERYLALGQWWWNGISITLEEL